jgi:triacylglycerol lipase
MLPGFSVALKTCLVLILFAFYINFNLRPNVHTKHPGQIRLKLLMGGRECILTAMACFLLEVMGHLTLIIFYPGAIDTSLKVFVINGIVCILLIIVLVINGCARIFITSKQVGILTKLLLFLLWWLPILNVLLLKKLCGSAVKEYVFITKKTELNKERRHEEICRTKYPLLFVHGIFWRDWKAFNYWGRIPKELEVNGAICHYGNNKSSASVADSGAESAECIRRIISETGCEKLNIIAHSKGGLDSRYAISCLGMGKYTASLTTVNTPHYGCNTVSKLVERLPRQSLSLINKKYESLYTILGDENPDFLKGLMGLTDIECAALNRQMPDDPQVYYQSVCSKMISGKGAVFPLNIGYRMIKSEEGENDGFVAVESMVWGNFLGVVTPSGKRGISHGDMIDLTRKNIEGFDVCEFYVDLVSGLKDRGL